MPEGKDGQQWPLDSHICQQYILNNVMGSAPECMQNNRFVST